MENWERFTSRNRDYLETLPSLIRYITENEVAGFDIVKEHNESSDKPATKTIYASDPPSSMGIEAAAAVTQKNGPESQRMGCVSITIPYYPEGNYSKHVKKRVLFDNINEQKHGSDIPNCAATSNYADAAKPTKVVTFHSQPMPAGSEILEAVTIGKFPSHAELPLRNLAIHSPRDKRFDPFKTCNGKLERQISNLRGKHQEPAQDSNPLQNIEVETLPVDRYFDALQGPELDTLRPSEEILLPEDKQWPFLLRFPISSFGICLGLSSQAIMWKALATAASTKFLHISLNVNHILWCISVALLVLISCIYFLKLVFYFEAVCREYCHPVRVNFFFAPWVSLLFLFLGVPPSVSQNLYAPLWYILMAPIFCLELKIYGQWMSGGQRRLSKIANPSNHLSVMGNFVGALLGASMGLKEGPIFFFAVGLAHYLVLFVTLYQRLPTNETLPKELHPVFFQFVAAPSIASMALARILGSFTNGSRIAYFIAMFLYLSLGVRINFFRGFRFSLAWWVYTFPMTEAAVATIRYSSVVTNLVTKFLTVILCAIATLTVAALLITTIIHAFVLRDLFPNDIAIAIGERRSKTSQDKWFQRRLGSSHTKDFKNFLKFVNSSYEKDIEASNTPRSSAFEEGCKKSTSCTIKQVHPSVPQP